MAWPMPTGLADGHRINEDFEKTRLYAGAKSVPLSKTLHALLSSVPSSSVSRSIIRASVGKNEGEDGDLE